MAMHHENATRVLILPEPMDVRCSCAAWEMPSLGNSADWQPRILLVDDEPQVVEALAIPLRRYFSVTTAIRGQEALELIVRGDPFAAVVSDLRMPGMEGPAFLSHARRLAPETARILLAGRADLDWAIAAVNEGHIFRLLTKPCPPESLRRVLYDAVAQARLGHPTDPSRPRPTQMRQHPRVHVRIEVTLDSESQIYMGLSENLSEGGVFVATYAPRRVGDIVELSLRLPQGKPIHTLGQVRWLREVSDRIDLPAGMGIRFMSLHGDEASIIRAFLAQRAPLLFEES
jgi:uncharacterized protein (TIGR02266 family)